MWFENFIPSLALSLNCLGAFLPGCFILPGSLAFRPGGLGKAAAEASQLGPKRTPSAQGEHLMCLHTHTIPAPRAQGSGSRDHLQPSGSVPCLHPALPISASLHKPQTHSTSRLLAPGGSSRNFFLFNTRQVTCCFRCQIRHNERIL